MQFVFCSDTAPTEPPPPPGGGGDADAAARRDEMLFGGEEHLLGPARALLSRTSLAAFLASRPRRAIAALETHMSVGDALALLAARRVLGAPLLDVQKKLFEGWVDVAAVARAFLEKGAAHVCAPCRTWRYTRA